MGNATKAFARGWHCLGLAKPFSDGEPHRVDMFGTRAVVFQGTDGKINCLEAWCPHMGADLCLGQVKETAIVCKFHNWHWEGDGKCSHVPYAKRKPAKASVRSWPTQVVNNMLFIWNDEDGLGPEPECEIPTIPQCQADDWSDWAVSDWVIDARCHEVIDNIADMAHFIPVHATTSVSYFQNLYEGHLATQVMVSGYKGPAGNAEFQTTATYYGPAYQITKMTGALNGLMLDMVLMNAHVPISHNQFRLRFAMMMKHFPGVPENQNEMMIKNFVQMNTQSFAADAQIWNNKQWMESPMLCDGDGPIAFNRRWYEQFYSPRGASQFRPGDRKVISTRDEHASPPPVEHLSL